MTSFLSKGIRPKEFFEVPHYTAGTVEEKLPIPNQVFQTWMRRRFRKEMYTVWQKNVAENPQFDFYVFQDSDCRKFLVNEFDETIVAAYDHLLPGAYKADLWRLCILYKRGGIYMDMKFRIIRPLVDLVKSLGDTTLVKDQWHPVEGITTIYQAVMIAKPGDPLLGRAIDRIVLNEREKYYGVNCLDPTGPLLVGRCLTTEDEQKIRLFIQLSGQSNCIANIVDINDIKWFQQYTAYRLNQNLDIVLYGTQQHYAQMWDQKQIYG